MRQSKAREWTKSPGDSLYAKGLLILKRILEVLLVSSARSPQMI